MAAMPNNQTALAGNNQVMASRRRGNKVRVMNTAASACHVLQRTKNKYCVEAAVKMSSSQRLTSLTRPTISSIAKVREKVHSANKGTITCTEIDKNRKRTKKSSSHVVKGQHRSIVPVRKHHVTRKPLIDQKMLDDLLPHAKPTGDVSDKIEVNQLLLDADTLVFRPFSESTESPSSVLSCSASESCRTQNKSTILDSLVNLPCSFASAMSFAAGFGVGLALGACGFLSSPRSA